ncbi:hypothetical protein GXW82_07610 [Streptacidiphilus sp. 4-A2]|nr:hypothetical protein [Streptacidiphilus sp. 4-A2]
MSGLEVIAVIGIIGFVIYQQVRGQMLRGKRVVLLPVVLTVIGFTDLHGTAKQPLGAADIVCLVIGAVGSIAVGLAFGAMTRLEARDGVLWGRLPLRGLWLWAALVGWRAVVFVLAEATHAHVAASSATLLFTLGLNRVAQAAVIMPRAMAAGIPFAPEKDGRTFLASSFERGASGSGWSRDRTGDRFEERAAGRSEDGFENGFERRGRRHHDRYDRQDRRGRHDRSGRRGPSADRWTER